MVKRGLWPAESTLPSHAVGTVRPYCRNSVCRSLCRPASRATIPFHPLELMKDAILNIKEGLTQMSDPKGTSSRSTKGRRGGTPKLRTVQRNGGHVTQIKLGNRDKLIGRYREEYGIKNGVTPILSAPSRFRPMT